MRRPGAVYRCWAEAEDARLPRFPSPEIKVADLTAFALQAACWGDPDASGLALLDPPPAGAMAAAREVLTRDRRGGRRRAGPPTRGVRMARLGLHPRLARALLDGAAEVGARRAAEVVALLSEEPPREYGDDLAAALADGPARAATRTRPAGGRRCGGCAPRCRRGARGRSPACRHGRGAERTGADGAGSCAALAFPERVGAGTGRRVVPDGLRDRGRAR